MTLAQPAHRVEQGGVSIMMPAYNAEHYIHTSIESALAQTFTNWELVIVDDGSTDGTHAVASSFQDPRIRVVQQPNQGESGARNTALAVMRGQYVSFLDADDLYRPNHLQRAIERFTANPSLAGVYTDGHHITEDGTQLKPLSSRRRPPRTGRVFDEVVYGSDFFGPPLCVVLRRDLIERHGLTFNRHIVVGPDWDFFMRFSNLGSFDYVDEKTCLYRVHRSSITGSMNAVMRAAERVKCRTSAIRHPSFAACPESVRLSVFYDLLIEALRNQPQVQSDVTRWPEFEALPRPTRAKLYRLLASEGVLLDYEPERVRAWLAQSLACKSSTAARVVQFAYGVSPNLCARLLQFRRRSHVYSIDLPPFLDLGTQ